MKWLMVRLLDAIFPASLFGTGQCEYLERLSAKRIVVESCTCGVCPRTNWAGRGGVER